MMDEKLTCPKCGSNKVAVTAEQMFMVNTGEHYCHSVKTHDSNAKATCLACRWSGERKDLVARGNPPNGLPGNRIDPACRGNSG